ncbi:MAG: PD40 domain-containing protein [Sedimentisphaerales bacterium]|nr:PD40 domain-containing protein [Sedimentisphaerales bacterium]
MTNFHRSLSLFITASMMFMCVSCQKKVPLESCTQVSRPAGISPDYSNTVIPPNVAPLNFRILENGDHFFVRVSSSQGAPIEVYSRNSNIEIPLRLWKTLLDQNRGKKLSFDVFVYNAETNWRRYQPIVNDIAKEPIDSYLVYRFIRPLYNYWNSICVYERAIGNYKNTLVLDGRSFNNGCTNCHAFCNNSPEAMSIATRSRKHGNSSLVVRDNNLIKVPTAWGYTAWHPSGRMAAYSINKVRQFFHTIGTEMRDVIDLDSAISYYKLDEKTAKIITALSEKNRMETYPTWSPDGTYLYYCSAPILWQDRDEVPPKDYNQVKYDLMRISYDLETDQWGKAEVVLSANETDMSILLPRVSPDGRFLVFVMCDYGCFPVYRPSSDLYIMDLKMRNYQKLDTVNSAYSESWHSWSSNSRWLTFSSKRMSGLFTRTYFTYIDENGKASKPFILPQKDPTYYDSLLQTYSVPELITHPVMVKPHRFARAAHSDFKDVVNLPVTGATKIVPSEPWEQQGE